MPGQTDNSDNVQRFTLTGADSSDWIPTEGSMRRAPKRKTRYAMLHIATANLRMAAWGVSVKPGLDGYR
jgi:hypothetical protein